MTLREEGKERRRKRIQEATVALLMKDGLSSLTVAKIAEQARVSVATIYNLVGPLDVVISTLLAKMFGEFEEIRLESSQSEDPIDAIYRFVEATVEHWAAEPERHQAMLRAVFELNIAQALSEPVIRVATRNQRAMTQLIDAARSSELLRDETRPERLAEQMLAGQTMLFQAWSVSLITLERYRLSCLYLFATSLRAWSTRKLTPRLDRTIHGLHQAFDALEESTATRLGRALS
jgi:AcrR family transcriptional regulator